MIDLFLTKEQRRIKNAYNAAIDLAHKQTVSADKLLEASQKALALAEGFKDWSGLGINEAEFLGILHSLRASALSDFPDYNLDEPFLSEIDAWKESIQYLDGCNDIELAHSCLGLANAFVRKIKYTRETNLNEAILYLDKAIPLVRSSTEERGIFTCAMCQLALGVFNLDIHEQTGKGVPDEAIDHIVEAISKFKNLELTHLLVEAEIIHGSAYLYRLDGVRWQNIERAIELLTSILEDTSIKDYREAWLNCTQHLARAYYLRVSGLYSDNIEYALTLLEEALIVSSETVESSLKARLLELLADVLMNRVRGEPIENFDRALMLLSQAKSFVNEYDHESEYAFRLDSKHYDCSIQLNKTYAKQNDRKYGDYLEDTDEKENKPPKAPINHADFLIKNLSRPLSDPNRAATHIHIGDFLMYMGIRNSSEDLDLAESAISTLTEAINHFSSAIQILEHKTQPSQIANIWVSMSRAYLIMFMMSEARDIDWGDFSLLSEMSPSHRGKTTIKLLNNAIDAQMNAISLYENSGDQRNLFFSLCEIGELFVRRREWESSVTYFKRAIEQGTQFIADPIPNLSELREFLSSLGKVAEHAPYASLICHGWREAIEISEGSRAMLLARAITINDLPFSSAEKKQIGDLQGEIINLDSKLTDHTTFNHRSVLLELMECRAKVREILDAHGDLNISQSEAIDIIQELIASRDNILIYPILTEFGGKALIICNTGGQIDIKEVEILDGIMSKALLNRNADLKKKWSEKYITYNKNRGTIGDWVAILNEVMEELKSDIVHPLVNAIGSLHETGYRKIHFISHYILDSLPISVTSTGLTYRKEHSLIGKFTISFSPSLIATKRCLKNGKWVPSPTDDIGIIYTTQDTDDPAYLVYSMVESSLVKGLSSTPATTMICGDDSNESEILKLIDGKEIWHFSSHGEFKYSNPLSSRLIFGKAELSLKSLFNAQALTPPKLVVLSACDTVHNDIDELPSEFIGFPAAFLQLGASGVVTTQWPVDDLATALLMGQFYQQMYLKKQRPVDALRAAQFWLENSTVSDILGQIDNWRERAYLSTVQAMTMATNTWLEQYNLDEKPYQHPAFWGAFVYYGI